MKNIKDIFPRFIGTILGYDCYVPDTYYNPLAFLKIGCPIWVKVTDDGNCETMVLEEGYAYSQIAYFIKHNLPKRHGYYCVKPQNAHPLSCQLYDENDLFRGEVVVDEHLTITSITLGNAEENDLLQSYFLMDYNIKGYEWAIIRIPQEYYNNAKMIFYVLTDDGYYIQLG